MDQISPGSIVCNGKFKLLSRLGLGGFGEVFLAETDVGLKAVKIVETALWSEDEYRVFNTMFMTEASFLASLCHQAIPRSCGLHAEGSRYFLVMDWVPGQTLREHVERDGSLSLDDLLGLIGSLVDVLDYLHRECEGVVVFGDLKPANVLRTEPGRYRLVDLGSASKKGARFSERYAVFSPGFSAPERKCAGPSHPSHDIYSLGATVYFAMLAREPVETIGQRERVAAVDRVMAREDEGWGATASEHLRGLLRLCMQAIEPLQERRPASIGDFITAWESTCTARFQELNRCPEDGGDDLLGLLYRSR